MSTDTPAHPKNLVDLMNQLVPPPEPESVSLVPQTFGWIVLAGIVLAIIAVVVRRHYLNKHANAYRHAALAALPAASDDPQELAEIIRKTALVAFPRPEVASLYGEDWLAFLENTCPGSQFRSGPGQFLAQAPYIKSASVPDGAVEALRYWIAHHNAQVAA